jgi:hypothetical protein
LTVTAVGGSDEIEQGLIFRDREQLTLAERPACRRKVAREYTYLTDIGITHGEIPPSDFGGGPGGKKTAHH